MRFFPTRCLFPALFVAAALNLSPARADEQPGKKTFFLPKSPTAAPHVLLITEARPTTAARHNFRRELLEISKDGQKKVAELAQHLLFGKDESTLVLLDWQEQSNGNHWNLWVIDRATTKVLAHRDLKNFPAVVLHKDCDQQLVVRSQDSMVCVPTFDSEQGFGFAEVNWKSGVRLNAKPYKGLRYFSSMFRTPSGFGELFDDWATSRVTPKLILFDAPTLNFRLVSPPGTNNPVYASDQIVFLPAVGLVQYHVDGLFRLSDARLGTNSATLEKTPISNLRSRIFPCSLNEKPCLAWGENPKPESRFGEISEIVIYDWNSKREFLRKALGTTTETFQLDQNGAKVYFLDAEQQQIKFLDLAKQVIEVFADLGKPVVRDPPKLRSFRSILDAY